MRQIVTALFAVIAVSACGKASEPSADQVPGNIPAAAVAPTPIVDNPAVEQQCMGLVNANQPAQLRAAYTTTAAVAATWIRNRNAARGMPYTYPQDALQQLAAIDPQRPLAVCYIYGTSGFGLPRGPGNMVADVNLVSFIFDPSRRWLPNGPMMYGPMGKDGVLPLEPPHI